MKKHLHTFRYNKVVDGKQRHRLITLRIWRWGFGMSYETKKSLGGFALNSKKISSKDTYTADFYTEK